MSALQVKNGTVMPFKNKPMIKPVLGVQVQLAYHTGDKAHIHWELDVWYSKKTREVKQLGQVTFVSDDQKEGLIVIAVKGDYCTIGAFHWNPR